MTALHLKQLCGLLVLALTLNACGSTLSPESGSSSLAASSAVSAGSNESAAAAFSVQDGAVSGPLCLPYSDEDSLSPYFSGSKLNTHLAALMHEGLFRLDTQWRAEPRVAESYTVENGYAEYVIKIREGLTFSDGSPVTTADVVFSFNAAARSTSLYRTSLSNVASARITSNDETSVTIRLKTPDHAFVNLLHFPIIKEQSGWEQNPVGLGRYVLSYDEGRPLLYASEFWSFGERPNFDTITLVPVEDERTLLYSVKTGIIHHIYTEMDEAVETVFSSTTVKPVTTNQLIFLGVNAHRQTLSGAPLREALSRIINREAIVSEACRGHGAPAQAPYNPTYYALIESGFSPISSPLDASTLDAIGFDNYNSRGVRLSPGGRTLSFSLLLAGGNAEKNRIAENLRDQLLALGVELRVEVTDYDTYLALIAAGEFDLYLGEINLTSNMDLTTLLDPAVSTAAAGVAGQEALLARYLGVRDGSATLSDFLQDFEKETPFIPLFYRGAIVAYSRMIPVDVPATAIDIFGNLEAWSFS